MAKPDKPAPTLEDVAKRAGVSTATVSRCLNTPERVVEKTRARVFAAVKALGYTPNFAARVMAAKLYFTIGEIIPTMENAIFAKGLQAFQEVLHDHGYTLLVASSAYQPEIEEEQIRTLISRGADGLLLIGHDRPPSAYDLLERQNVPAVVAWAFDPQARAPSVGFDNRAAMAAMTRQVLDLGHTRLGMISGIQAGNDRARYRVQGFQDALAKRGLDRAAAPIVETPYGIDTGGDAMAQLMQIAPRPTAVICGSDVLAVGALRAAQSLGLDVPRDVSITGFDDMELANIVRPALATVHVPHRDMGAQAARALIDMVEGKDGDKSARLATTVITRASLAAPKS